MSKKITDAEFKEYYEENPDSTQESLAEHFNVTQSTISKKIKKLYGSKEKRLEGESLNMKYNLPELIARSEVYTHTQTFYIKTAPVYVEKLRRKLIHEYSEKKPYHIIDIIKCEHGLLVITNDLLLGENLKSMSKNH